MKFILSKRILILKTIMQKGLILAFIFNCYLLFGFSSSHGFSQTINVTGDNSYTVDEIFNLISDQSEVSFIYREDLFRNAPEVSLKAGKQNIDDLLIKALQSTDYSYLIEKNTIIIIPKRVIKENQEILKITGTVIDKNTKETLIGASIVIDNTTIGTTTDENGEYELKIPSNMEGDIILVASFVGYEPLQEKVSLGGIENIELNFELEQKTLGLGDVVVTANKRNKTVMETPTPVQAITSDFIENMGLQSNDDIINFVPGASQTNSSSIGEKAYQLRGVPSIAGDATVGYYLGEASYNYYGAYHAPLSRAFDMERIEILRGPQSTLYGGGAMGGVIKFIPNKPNLKEIEGEVVVGGSTLDGGDPGYYGDLAISVPVIKDKLGVRVTGSYEEVGGYMETLAGDENIDGGNLKQVRPSLLFKPIDNLEIDLTYQYNGFEQFANTMLFDTIPPISMSNPDDKIEVNNNWYIGTITYDISDFAKITSATSYIDNKKDATMTFFIPGLGELNFVNFNYVTSFNNETRITSMTDSPFQWIAGFFYNTSELNMGSIFDNMPDLNSQQYLKSTSYSFFGEVSYALFDNKLIPLIGLRYYTDSRSHDYTDQGGLQDDKFETFNPKFNLSYHPNQNQNYFINIAKGFRSGVFNNLAWMQPHIDQGFPVEVSIPSDELWSYELGCKQDILGELLVELSVYYQDWQGMQTALADPVMGWFNTYQLGDVSIYGTDLALIYKPLKLKGLLLQSAFNYNNATYADINPELQVMLAAENGDRIPYVPAWTFGITAGYIRDFNSTNDFKGFANVGFTYADAQVGVGGANSDGDSQEMLRARIGVENNHFTIALFGNNILNEQGAIFRQVSALTMQTRTRPASFGIELRYQL